MAVDTRDKRGSAIGTAPSTSVFPDADGDINSGDRLQVAGLYRGTAVTKQAEGYLEIEDLVAVPQLRAGAQLMPRMQVESKRDSDDY